MDSAAYITIIQEALRSANGLMFKAPGRINIIGEHTDYNQGLCMPAAIDKSIYFGIIPSHETEIISVNQGNNWFPVQENKMPDWAIYFKGVFDLLKQQGYSWPYFKLAFGGDLPSGAGLSSSSAITCGFISILNEYANLSIAKEKLTQFAVQAEKASGLEGGMMDQISIMNGKKDHALMIDCSNWKYIYIPVSFTDVCCIIIDTKVKHRLVDTEYNSRSKSCGEILQTAKQIFSEINSLSQLNEEQIHKLSTHLTKSKHEMLKYIFEENMRVIGMEDAIKRSNYIAMGNLLFEGHEGLRKQYKVSCEELNFLVDYARNNCYPFGARLMGGGFGGCTLHLVPMNEKVNYETGIANAFKNRFGYLPGIIEVNIEEGVRKVI
jgi:galactokinase